jgi:RNA-binding protein PNO1
MTENRSEGFEEPAKVAATLPLAETLEDDELMIDTEPIVLPTPSGVVFEPLPASEQRSTLKSETRRISVPPHRMSPLQKEWINVFGPLTELLGLQVRMNLPRKSVEIRVSNGILCSRHASNAQRTSQTSKHTKEVGSLQKGADFIKAFALGFDVNVGGLTWDLFVD